MSENEKQRKPAFAEELEAALQGPEDLHQPTRIIPVPVILTIATLSLIVFVLVAWGFWGRVDMTLSGEGIILPEPTQVFVADARAPGVLDVILVQPGSYVKKGQVIALVNQSELVQQITATERYIDQLRAQQQQVQDESTRYQKVSEDYLKKVTASLQQKREDANRYELYLRQLFDSQKMLQNEGAITLMALEDTQLKLFETLEKIRDTDQQFANSQWDLENSRLQWLSQLNQIDLQILSQENQLNLLKLQYDDGHFIRSPIDGMVDQILAPIGQELSSGTDILSVVQEGHEQELLAFFSPNQGKHLEVGMPSYVTPFTVNNNEYGSIKATVVKVNNYPASTHAIYALVGNQDLADQLAKEGGNIIVHLHLQKDPKSLTGFQWTSRKGPPFKITSGTLAHVEIVVRTQQPITLVLPFLKSLIYGEQ